MGLRREAVGLNLQLDFRCQSQVAGVAGWPLKVFSEWILAILRRYRVVDTESLEALTDETWWRLRVISDFQVKKVIRCDYGATIRIFSNKLSSPQFINFKKTQTRQTSLSSLKLKYSIKLVIIDLKRELIVNKRLRVQAKDPRNSRLHRLAIEIKFKTCESTEVEFQSRSKFR